ncbi:uncharacterized protein [Argopecten irradians]|uniref:uncharacterized protein n=1 Tax=Argopecten irradians TaxID=31199 RepID=UPI003724BBC3
MPKPDNSSESELSGIQAIELSESELSGVPEEITTQCTTEARLPELEQQGASSSFIDPFDLTITVSEGECTCLQDMESECGDDIDFEPSFDITLGPMNFQEVDDVSFGDIEMGYCEDNTEEDLGREEFKGKESGTGVRRVYDPEHAHFVAKDEACLIYLNPLLQLASNLKYTCQVKGCGRVPSIKHSFVGSAIYLKWVCEEDHLVYQWCSQPVLRRGLHTGDIMMSSALFTSGNNYGKVALFAQFLRLHFVSSAVYSRLQRCYIVPTIDQAWTDHQQSVFEEFRGKDLVILGDGRMDSPGYNAKFCSYTVMENDSKKILSLVTVDKRETEKKSCLMEKAGFQKVMRELSRDGMSVKEVVTDAHSQIGAFMKKDYPEIKHSHDIWHTAKNLGKKIITAGQDKECQLLQKWSQDISNHFWHVAQTANTYEDFIGLWSGVLHHVVDEHSWLMQYSDNCPAECSHGPLTTEATDEKWLEKGSKAHHVLRKIVLDKRFLNKVPYYLNARTTAELENFHQLILMYASKRFAYSPPVYRARNILAALDYNSNLNRDVKKRPDGTVRMHRTFNKKSKRWTVYPEKVAKTYKHIDVILEQIVRNRLEDRLGMHREVELPALDPRRLSKTIAPISPPPTEQLEKEKKSRVEKKDD